MKIDNVEEKNLQISIKFSGKSRVMKKAFSGLSFWKFDPGRLLNVLCTFNLRPAPTG